MLSIVLLGSSSFYNQFIGRSCGGLSLHFSAQKSVHLGVHYLNVVQQVGQIINVTAPVRTFELMIGGDLYTLTREMIRMRGPGTCAISKVKGHADEEVVMAGRVRLAMIWQVRLLILEARVTDSRRALARIGRHWYPIVWDLHKFCHRRT